MLSKGLLRTTVKCICLTNQFFYFPCAGLSVGYFLPDCIWASFCIRHTRFQGSSRQLSKLVTNSILDEPMKELSEAVLCQHNSHICLPGATYGYREVTYGYREVNIWLPGSPYTVTVLPYSPAVGTTCGGEVGQRVEFAWLHIR